MTREEMSKIMTQVFAECAQLREAGQREYSHREDSAFANFERVAERMGLNRKQALMIYTEKHLDGIHSYLKGHQSQREDVRGRINDVIVYMCLLRGMIEEEQKRSLADLTMQQMQQMQQSSPSLGVFSLGAQR